MINYDTIETCFTEFVGFNQTSNTNLAPLTPSLILSGSGVRINEFPGISLSVLFNALSQDESSLNTYLAKVIKTETNNAIRDFVNRHKELTKARHLLEDISLTKSVYDMSDTVTKTGRFVGIYFKPKNAKNVALILRRIGTQFSALQTGLTIYLFTSSQKTAIKTISIDVTKTDSVEFRDLTDFICAYRSIYGENQEFYLGYFEDDLTGNAIDTDLYNCGSTARFTDIYGFEFASGVLDGINLPTDADSNISKTDKTYGLHVWADATCDITTKICDNKTLFSRLIALKCSIRLLNDLFDSLRINRDTNVSQENVLTNLQINKDDYNSELKGIRLDFTDLDSYCMPCDKGQIQRKTIS